jgi:copper chaperone
MRYEVERVLVDNLKCGGCAHTITEALLALPGVSNVTVDVEGEEVRYEGAAQARQLVANTLHKLGYPERGTASGVDAAVSAAKSFVSCAVGRIKA